MGVAIIRVFPTNTAASHPFYSPNRTRQSSISNNHSDFWSKLSSQDEIKGRLVISVTSNIVAIVIDYMTTRPSLRTFRSNAFHMEGTVKPRFNEFFFHCLIYPHHPHCGCVFFHVCYVPPVLWVMKVVNHSIMGVLNCHHVDMWKRRKKWESSKVFQRLFNVATNHSHAGVTVHNNIILQGHLFDYYWFPCICHEILHMWKMAVSAERKITKFNILVCCCQGFFVLGPRS